MDALRHYIDFLDGAGYIEVIPPKEWKGLSIENVFDSTGERLSTSSFTWVDEPAIKMMTYFENGITGTSNGILEGLPYQVTFDCDGTSYTIVKACINLASSETEFDYCDIVKAPIKETGNKDFLNTRADSFRFEYLASLSPTSAGYIGSSDYIDIWYMDGAYPRKAEIIMAAITIFIISKEIYETIKRIVDVISATSGGVTGAVETALQLVALAIYLAVLIIALVNLILDLIDLIFPFVYFHRGMYVRTLCQKACAYLGFTFSSTIFSASSFSYNQYILPPKDIEGKKVGVTSNEVGYYQGTFGDLLRALIEQYNAEITIIGNVLYLERKGYFSNFSTYRIPEVKSIRAYTTNAEEVNANYTIEYIYDKIDLNDYDAENGRIIQATHEPISVHDKKNILLQGLKQRLIPFTLVNVKTSTSRLEQVMATIFNLISSLISAMSSVISGSGASSPIIPSSINILNIDTHFISEHKTGIYLGSGKTDPLTATKIGARALWVNYHFIEMIKPIYSSIGNQWYKYKGKVPMCCEDYMQLLNNNYATYKGVASRVTSVKWNPYDQVADIEFEVNKLWTSNLRLILQEPYQSNVIFT